MKPLAIPVLALALVTASAKATFGHVDSLGQPDPYWQQIAAASAVRGSQVPPPEDSSPFESFLSLGGLSLLILAFGVAVVLDLATAPESRKATRTDDRARRMSPTDPAETMQQQTIRTVEVLPLSASRETRYVLRLAAAIVFGVLFFSALHAKNVAGNDSAPPACERATDR